MHGNVGAWVDETTPTWSGPCWATIATGTGVASHGIIGNDLTGHRLAGHPDFVTRATRAGLPTLLAVSGWPPLLLSPLPRSIVRLDKGGSVSEC